MSDNPYVDTPIGEDGVEFVHALWEATLWGCAGLIATACIGGIGMFPGAIYGWRKGKAQGRAHMDANRGPDGTVAVRDVIHPDHVALWEEVWVAEQGANRPLRPKLPPVTEDKLYQALRGLNYTAAEAKAVVPQVPADAAIHVRIRLALQILGRGV